jgi:iron complex outermembrane receptor protein
LTNTNFLLIMKRTLTQRGTLLLATAFIQATAFAHEEPVQKIEPYVISAGPMPLPLSEFSNPITIIESEELLESSANTLGAALGQQAGISQSAFAAGVSRPVIRGYQGPRVRILSSGLEAADVSVTSPDHAVVAEPLLSERIEVLRGPSTLLYGGAAIGGVVNVQGRELPRKPGSGLVTGGIDLQHATGSQGETAAGFFNYGSEQWALSVTGLQRRLEDYELPSNADEAKMYNSGVETDQFSLGASWFFDEKNYIGLALSNYTSLYGVPGHEEGGHGGGEHHDVLIDLERKSQESELYLHQPSALIEHLKLHAAYTDYVHDELEEGASEITYDREAWELRAEAAHLDWGLFDQGLLGLQFNGSEFAATGSEHALTPPSSLESQALFVNEHLHRSDWHYELGARLERQTIAVSDAQSDYSDVAFSGAASVILDLTAHSRLAASLSYSQRHPNETELYSDGEHHATEQYLRGDAVLDLETAYGLDLTWRCEHSDWSALVSVYYTLFDNYIFDQSEGIRRDHDGNISADDEDLEAYQFTAVDAEFYGFEAECAYRLYSDLDSEITWGLMADSVRATERSSGGDLPRIAPMRIGSHLDALWGDWSARLAWLYAFKQQNVAPDGTQTPSYTLLDLSLGRRIALSNRVELNLYLRADNLLDDSVRHHTAYNKDEVMQAGRNFTVGARLEF